MESATSNRQHAYVEVEVKTNNGEVQTWKYYANKGVGNDMGGGQGVKPFVYVDRADGKGLVKMIPTDPHGSWHTESAIGEIMNKDFENRDYLHRDNLERQKMRLYTKMSPCIGMCLDRMLKGTAFTGSELKIAFDDFYSPEDGGTGNRVSEENKFRTKINDQLSKPNNYMQFYRFGGVFHSIPICVN